MGLHDLYANHIDHNFPKTNITIYKYSKSFTFILYVYDIFIEKRSNEFLHK